MFKRSWAVCGLTALLVSGTAAAQSPRGPVGGTIELGAFGQWTWFDENAGSEHAVPKDGFGYGGRIGAFLSRRFQLEADGYYSPQARELTERFCCLHDDPTDINASALALRLNYNFPMGRHQFILGAGAVRTNYSFEGGSDDHESVHSYGPSGLLGFRIGIANRIAIRLDGVIDHMPNHEPSANTNLHARAGLSLLLGGAAGVATLPAEPPPPRHRRRRHHHRRRHRHRRRRHVRSE